LQGIIHSYWATPLPWSELSPAELLMGRKIRTDIPQVNDQLVLKWNRIQHFKMLDPKYKQNQKDNYDRRHRVKTLPDQPANQHVWVDD